MRGSRRLRLTFVLLLLTAFTLTALDNTTAQSGPLAALRNGIDTVIDLELFSRFTALLTGLSGADRRVGFHRFHNEGLYRGETRCRPVTRWYLLDP